MGRMTSLFYEMEKCLKPPTRYSRQIIYKILDMVQPDGITVVPWLYFATFLYLESATDWSH